jgi:hypothetical protein
MKAMEAPGKIDTKGFLIPDHPLKTKEKNVKVIISIRMKIHPIMIMHGFCPIK